MLAATGRSAQNGRVGCVGLDVTKNFTGPTAFYRPADLPRPGLFLFKTQVGGGDEKGSAAGGRALGSAPVIRGRKAKPWATSWPGSAGGAGQLPLNSPAIARRRRARGLGVTSSPPPRLHSDPPGGLQLVTA